MPSGAAHGTAAQGSVAAASPGTTFDALPQSSDRPQPASGLE